METLLFLGGIGLLVLLIVVILGFGRTWWIALECQSWAMAWWAATATFCLLENITESMIVYNSIFWWLLSRVRIRRRAHWWRRPRRSSVDVDVFIVRAASILLESHRSAVQVLTDRVSGVFMINFRRRLRACLPYYHSR